MLYLPWIVVAALAALVGLLAGWAWCLQRRRRRSALPREWPLSTRPLFNPKERLFYRLLRDALPHHVILAKMPLVRFCRPVDQAEVRYWHEVLGSVYVTFIVCAPNGRVLAALDVDSERRPPSTRLAVIKQQVLQACRVQYVKCHPDQFPSVAELQMLVPQQGGTGRGAVPETVDSAPSGHATLAHAVRARHRPNPPPGWRDSVMAQDSFFAPDSRDDDFGPSGLTNLPPATAPAPLPGAPSPPAPQAS